MPSVKRNDPCPCGSGRKYKNCCMRQDQAATSRTLNLGRAESHALNLLYNHAMTQRFAHDFAEAFGIYWGGVFALGDVDNFDSEDLRRTLEWFVHDYRTSQNGRHVIDHFIETQTQDFPKEALDIVTAWSASVPGLYRILSTDDSHHLSLYDCLRQSELDVVDAALSRRARAGDIAIGRLYELDGTRHLSLMTMLLPGEFESGLTQYVTHAYELYCSEHPQATWERFLRENGHIFQAYLFSPPAEGLRSLIGPGTPYHDPMIARDKLRQATREAREREQREQAQAQQPARPQMKRTDSGIILPGAAARKQEEAEPEARSSRILIPGRDL